jgi:hypothetical protein
MTVFVHARSLPGSVNAGGTRYRDDLMLHVPEAAAPEVDRLQGSLRGSVLGLEREGRCSQREARESAEGLAAA